MAVDTANQVWAATRAGLYRLPAARQGWERVAPEQLGGPVYAVAVDHAGSVWVGAWDGLHEIREGTAHRVAGMHTPVRAVTPAGDTLLTGGPAGFYRVRGGVAEAWEPGCTRYVRDILSASDGTLWLATAMGLYGIIDGQGAYLTPDFDRRSIDLRGLGQGPSGEIWVAMLGGVAVLRDRQLHQPRGIAEGLPSVDVRCIAHAPDGAVWIGTAAGLVRWDGRACAVRQGRRWLLDDDVRDLACDSAGGVWAATGQGVSRLAPTRLTLAAKAEHFQSILAARHIRPPGIVGPCRLRVPGELSTWQAEDDDNDGGYTAVYLAMESYRYAVTRSPEARAAAERAFATLEFLQQVTGTEGFIARTVVPADWSSMHDPNVQFTDAVWAEQWVGDPRNKRVPLRWRRSTDGAWLWKGDTSSDEITAHLFGCSVFHALAADAPHRARIRTFVDRIVGHLLQHGLVLVDDDGRPTRWGVWAPERLNHDPDWAMERGINSVEILSFLKLAAHLTANEAYEAQFRRLIHEHHYARNVLEAPNLNPAWRTYIDTELLAFAYPALLTLEHDPALRRVFRQSYERWHGSIRADGNPFFEFLYAACAEPDRANLGGALAFLRDVPLDLVQWTADASAREDVRPSRVPVLEAVQTDRLLPPSEICYTRTDQNPWRMVQGNGGETESDGVFFLLPYWMGRHHGWIGPAD